MILIVDDDPDIRETFALVLESRGYAVRMAANGREALELVRAVDPDLVLLDLMMPVMNGPDFLAALRADPAFDHIRVVIVSAWPRESAAVAGADAVLPKPVEVRTLVGAAERFAGPPGS